MKMSAKKLTSESDVAVEKPAAEEPATEVPAEESSSQPQAEQEAPAVESEGQRAEPEPAAAEQSDTESDNEPSPEHEHLGLIREANAEARELEVEYLSDKESAKNSKKAWETSVSSLCKLIENPPRPLPLFDKKPAPTENKKPKSAAEAWRETPVEEIFSPGVCKIVHKSDIINLGGITDWTARDKQLVDLPGIGKKKAEDMENDLIKFWAAHPEYTQSEAETPTEAAESESDATDEPFEEVEDEEEIEDEIDYDADEHKSEGNATETAGDETTETKKLKLLINSRIKLIKDIDGYAGTKHSLMQHREMDIYALMDGEAVVQTDAGDLVTLEADSYIILEPTAAV